MKRRDFMLSSSALILAGCNPAPSGKGEEKETPAASVDLKGLTPEKTDLSFGFIPLTDCAPLVIAYEKGYFSKYGLNVLLSKEASWANIRDKVSLGALDGAHMLAGMPLAASLGIGATQKPTVTGFSMDLNGNGITVSNELYQKMQDVDPEALLERPVSARALKKVIDAEKAQGKEPMTFAMVFPVSTHNYEIRYWMAASGIDPDQDVRLIVIPPPQMVANLRAGNIVGYCVGEPWNARAVEAGIGRTLITNYEIWNNNPEKVFGVNKDWADQYPQTHQLTIMALLEAARWLDDVNNRVEAAEIIAEKSYVNAPAEVVKMSMTGTFKYAADEPARPMPDFNVFYRYAANFPWRSHALWFLTQMVRWGQMETPVNLRSVAEQVYLPDVYRKAAQALNIPYPTIDYKKEGTQANAWQLSAASAPITMGSDLFIDKKVFDPDEVMAYINSFAIQNVKLDLAAFKSLNS